MENQPEYPRITPLGLELARFVLEKLMATVPENSSKVGWDIKINEEIKAMEETRESR